MVCWNGCQGQICTLIGLIPNNISDSKLLKICVLTRILENLQMLVKLVVLFFQVTITTFFSRGAGRGRRQ